MTLYADYYSFVLMFSLMRFWSLLSTCLSVVDNDSESDQLTFQYESAPGLKIAFIHSITSRIRKRCM